MVLISAPFPFTDNLQREISGPSVSIRYWQLPARGKLALIDYEDCWCFRPALFQLQVQDNSL